MVDAVVTATRPDPWVIVAPGFHRGGGMERANLELAAYLLEQGTPLHLVAFTVDEELANQAAVTVHLVPRPGGSYFLGERFLDRTGRAVAASVTGAHPGSRVVVNGGNCLWGDLNWVHYVHHAWRPEAAKGPWWFRAKDRLLSSSARRREAAALRAARMIFANSRRTAEDLTGLLNLEADRVHTVYLGVDPAFGPITGEERVAARRALGQPDDRPLVLFVGALGYDRRKGFDTLWSAWEELCAGGDWDADLVVAGGGREVAYWQDQARGSAASSSTRVLGFSDRIADLLAAADLLVSPVRYEPYGLNVQEALCRGVPALVSADAGVAEHYPSALRGMLLEDPSDSGELRDGLGRWRKHIDEIRLKFQPVGASLRARSWSAMAGEIVALANPATATREHRPV